MSLDFAVFYITILGIFIACGLFSYSFLCVCDIVELYREWKKNKTKETL